MEFDRGESIMVDRTYLDTEKLTIYENRKVKKLNKSNRINDDLNNNKNKNFKEQLNKFKKQPTKDNIKKVDKDNEPEGDIIVAESLIDLMNENRIITEVVREKLLNDAKFLRFICSSLGNKMDTSSRNGSINLLYPLENRLASYIMATREDGNRVVFNETLTEIAELLGTSYRHLLRTINNLINREVLKKDNYGYEIINEEILSSLAVDLYK